MPFADFYQALKVLGREITPEAVAGTRALIEPLLPQDMLAGVKVSRDLAYGEDERQRLDIFTPADEDGAQRPVLVFIHGGGFVMGDKHSEGSPFFSNIGAWAVRNGFCGVNLTYRLAPAHQWPSGVEDLRAAVEYLHARGMGHGLNGDKLVLMGQSAGGAHVAAYLAHPEIYQHLHHGVRGAVMLSGVYDFTTMPTTNLERAYLGEDETRYAERSSLEGLLDCDIPLLVSMAEFDPPPFQAQCLQLLTAWHQRHQALPTFVHLLGQNHMSPAMSLGLIYDLLAPQLKRFIENLAYS